MRRQLAVWLFAATQVTAGAGTGTLVAMELRGPEPGDASHPTPAFDGSGKLWLAFDEGEFVYVTSSNDLGASFGPAVAVNPEPEALDVNGEARPKIAVTSDGTLLVTWTRRLDKPYTGEIRFSRSIDGGRGFSAPTTLNDDGLVTGHRFDALSVAPSGEVLVAWIDKRDLDQAASQGIPYAGAAIYFAVSKDNGESFEPNRKLKDNVCECCRLSFGFDANGKASLLFRDVLEGSIRDHVLVQGLLERGGARAHRVTFDDWKIEACPHHGPSLAIDSSDTYHITWFTAGDRSGTGIFYARSTDGGETFTGPLRVGDERAAHPYILASGMNVHLVWMEADSRESLVRAQTSEDGGASWTTPTTLATGSAGADHPLLVKRGAEVFLSWFSKDRGYRLMATPDS